VPTSTLEALQCFATGLYEDYAAVKAGVTLPWSTSPVEGHINRLTMLKRQVFGRECLDLLSRRFVRIPGRGHEGVQRGQESSETHTGVASRVAARSRLMRLAWRVTITRITRALGRTPSLGSVLNVRMRLQQPSRRAYSVCHSV
jgi:hypothetical protein